MASPLTTWLHLSYFPLTKFIRHIFRNNTFYLKFQNLIPLTFFTTPLVAVLGLTSLLYNSKTGAFLPAPEAVYGLRFLTDPVLKLNLKLPNLGTSVLRRYWFLLGSFLVLLSPVPILLPLLFSFYPYALLPGDSLRLTLLILIGFTFWLYFWTNKCTSSATFYNSSKVVSDPCSTIPFVFAKFYSGFVSRN